MRSIFSGATGAIRDAVVLNSAAALVAGDAAATLPDGIEMASTSIVEGSAARKLDALVELSQRLGR